MRIMNGWTIELADVFAGLGMLAILVISGYLIGVMRAILAMDFGETEDDCYCPGSGHEPRDKPDTCRRCGRYVEIGGE